MCVCRRMHACVRVSACVCVRACIKELSRFYNPGARFTKKYLKFDLKIIVIFL